MADISDFVQVIKREEYNCPRTHTIRTRDGGKYELPVKEAVEGIKARTHRAPGYAVSVVPGAWEPKKKKVSDKETED